MGGQLQPRSIAVTLTPAPQFLQSSSSGSNSLRPLVTPMRGRVTRSNAMRIRSRGGHSSRSGHALRVGIKTSHMNTRMCRMPRSRRSATTAARKSVRAQPATHQLRLTLAAIKVVAHEQAAMEAALAAQAAGSTGSVAAAPPPPVLATAGTADSPMPQPASTSVEHVAKAAVDFSGLLPGNDFGCVAEVMGD